MSDRRRGPAERPNFGQPSLPRPAASVVLLRQGGVGPGRGLEVLLLRRNERARFMPGVWVFPGGAVDPGEGDDDAGHRACAARELAEEAGIGLPEGAELVLFSRWITPEVISTRFDARFYLALAPPGCDPRPDGEETIDAGWFTPEAALLSQAAGEMALAFPTVKQLEALREFGTAEGAIAAHRGRAVEPILPKVVGTREEPRILLPGDAGYPAG